jgi:tetratricopeptide (TPR) repeat protein
MLWGDKGGRALDQTREGEALRVASHQGGASVFVNFDALACWLGWRGCAEAPDNEPDFVIGATLLARKAWRLDELIGDALSSAVHPLRAQKAVTALRGAEARVLICAVLALEPDGDVLLELADSLVAAAAGAGAQLPASQRHALGAWLLDAVRSAFYLPADDVAFQAGRVLHMLGFAGAAASCFGHSLAHHHEHASARFNLAVCLAELGELTEATRALHQVLATDPTHARARELLVHLGELSLGPAP